VIVVKEFVASAELYGPFKMAVKWVKILVGREWHRTGW
jgi:hypothetical protein